jgi:hypothetical protein
VRRQRGPDGDLGGGWRGVKANAEEEQLHGMDPMVIGEAICEAPTVDPLAVQAWRWPRSEHAGGGEMIVASVRV